MALSLVSRCSPNRATGRYRISPGSGLPTMAGPSPWAITKRQRTRFCMSSTPTTGEAQKQRRQSEQTFGAGLMRLRKQLRSPRATSLGTVTGNNADSCIRSAAGKASPSRRAVSALRIQGIGLNRREADAYGDSNSSRLPGQGTAARQQRSSVPARPLRVPQPWLDAAPKWAVLGLLDVKSRIGGQGIHGHPPRAVSTTVSHRDLSFPWLRVQDVSIAARSVVGSWLTGAVPLTGTGSQGLDDHHPALAADRAEVRHGLLFNGSPSAPMRARPQRVQRGSRRP